MPQRRYWADEESGQALVITLVLVVVGLGLIMATVSLALGGLRTSHSDSSTEASLHAADAGISTALWRTNKLLVGGQVDSLLGLVNGVLLTLGCTEMNVGANGESSVVRIKPQGTGATVTTGVASGTVTSSTSTLVTPSTSAGAAADAWCAGTRETNGDGGTYEYWESTGVSALGGSATVTLPTGTSPIAALYRVIVSVGTVGNQSVRVMAILSDSPGTSGSDPTALWKETYYGICPPPPADYADPNSPFAAEPDAGCPSAAAPPVPASW